MATAPLIHAHSGYSMQIANRKDVSQQSTVDSSSSSCSSSLTSNSGLSFSSGNAYLSFFSFVVNSEASQAVNIREPVKFILVSLMVEN